MLKIIEIANMNFDWNGRIIDSISHKMCTEFCVALFGCVSTISSYSSKLFYWYYGNHTAIVVRNPAGFVSKSAPITNPAIHQTNIPQCTIFVTEMCTCVHISVTKRYIVGYGIGASWDLSNSTIDRCQTTKPLQSAKYGHIS